MRFKGSGVACGIVAAVLTTGSSAGSVFTQPNGAVPPSRVADEVVADRPHPVAADAVVGLVPSKPEPPNLRAVTSPLSETEATSARPVNSVVAVEPGHTPKVLGIPEVVLAAYRNAELAMAATTPGCGITWNLLAAIGKIESGHASGGNTDSEGTTVAPILGPALDGTLPGNEVIRAADSTYVRAVGPMQFLPNTWVHYAADGNGDGATDPNNVFDAALAAAQYLCSGGLDLRDPATELRAILRYNNSTAYASDVLSWSASYGSGGTQPMRFEVPAPVQSPEPDVTDAVTSLAQTPEPSVESAPVPLPAPMPQMITIPGFPPIPCGIFCPPAPMIPATQ